ncbi:Redox-sensing transcriptional repressor Rex [bioreactor metagenome]|uniref:Redox-sensing transcriptional repressor Rex n=1 Tax=bioreactor metagenome TaxID=1076179 RepID=A0A645FBQ4_9ZZZZ
MLSKNGEISISVIKRIPRYYRFLEILMNEGVTKISSNELAARMSTTASQIRQDLNCFGCFGMQGYGYNIKQLHSEIGKILNVNKISKMVLIGAGNLGHAIASHMDFKSRGFSLIGIFDKDPDLIGKEINGMTITSMDELDAFCKKNTPKSAIICVPYSAAPEIVKILIENKVKGFWNFSHYNIMKDYPNTVVENVHLSDSLMTLSYQMKK